MEDTIRADAAPSRMRDPQPVPPPMTVIECSATNKVDASDNQDG
jgi:hypothetical protein